jgi:phage gpG-like protein
LINSNLRLVQTGWARATKGVDLSARAARDEMMSALIQLSKQEIKGKRPKNTVAWQGFPAPPMNRTGDLRASIRGEKFTIGFANYTAVVGPTIVYARKVELGGPNWKPGVRFPYMEPAYMKFRSIYPQITRKFFGRLK